MEDHEIKLVEIFKKKEFVQLSYDSGGWSKLEYKEGKILFSEIKLNQQYIEDEVVSELKAFLLLKDFLQSDARKWAKEIPRSGEELIEYWKEVI